MKLIHCSIWIKKLSTLKHSPKGVNFPLKRSHCSAETLPLSIYAYIYLYLNTCSWQLQAVNYGDKTRITILSILLMSCFMTGCQKTIVVCNQPIHPFSVTERPETLTHPTQFYLCGNAQYPCSTTNNRRVTSHSLTRFSKSTKKEVL